MALKTTFQSDEISKVAQFARCQRDQVIWSFYSDTGTRESELLGITVQNIDFDSGEVLIPHLKHGIKKKCPKCSKSAGRSSRWCVHCGADLSKVVAEGIQERSRIITVGPETLELLREFTAGMQPDEKVIKLSRQSIYNIVRTMAEDAGFKGRIFLNPTSGIRHFPHPHLLRSSLAVDWLAAAGGDMTKQKALQDHLGHAEFSTTQRYNVLASAQVKKMADEVRQSRFKKV